MEKVLINRRIAVEKRRQTMKKNKRAAGSIVDEMEQAKTNQIKLGDNIKNAVNRFIKDKEREKRSSKKPTRIG